MSLRAKLCVLLLLLCVGCNLALAQSGSSPMKTEMPKDIPVPAAAQPSDHFNPEAATNAYLDLIPATARARSDAYFEGGYWLTLWDFLAGAVIALLLITTGWSTRMRDLAERVTRFRPVHTFIYWIEYLILTSLLAFPLTWYEGFYREHQYGLANQTFGPWMVDQFKGLFLGAILGGVLVVALFGVLRRFKQTWWIWGAAVMTVFLIFFALIVPVFVVPMFNKVTKLQDPKILQPILSLARANGIPAHDVYETDASKQTTRMSANVSGFGNTMRITLNDNLINRATPEEVQAVMGHEMGHYVLNHVYKGIMMFGILIVALFAYLKLASDYTLSRWGQRWNIRDIGDVNILPLAILVISIFGFITTPITNTMTRVQEAEADIFGINASRQPDGFARAAIHLGEYRKMSPGPIEEFVFYDHPSGRARIFAAMRWKAENLALMPPAPVPTLLPAPPPAVKK